MRSNQQRKMQIMNMVILSGNIGSEPEFSEYADGTRRVSFSVALDQYNKSGEKTDVFWFYCCAWDSVSDRLQQCQRSGKLAGRRINITGAMIQKHWLDVASGEKRSRIYLNVHMFDLERNIFPSSTNQTTSQPSAAELIFEGRPAFPPRQRPSRKYNRSK
jgi:single-stranded DNA-binding protein